MNQKIRFSIIIPVLNAARTLENCLQAIYALEYRNFECIIVDDGSTDDSPAIVQNFPFRFVQLSGGPFGPAFARNRGAEIAIGEFLFFVDADVIVYPDTLTKIDRLFSEDGQLDALFGSYDDEPRDSSFLSQYKNLMHHYIHQQSQPKASTFWSGCGAIRKRVFLQANGFDTVRYSHPSIEDIELGARLVASGHKILLIKDVQVKHLKRWTLVGLIKTDVIYRAIPWTNLILRGRNLPNDLNLRSDQRASAIIAILMILFLVANLFTQNFWLLPAFCLLYLSFVNLWEWGKFSNSKGVPGLNGLIFLMIVITTVVLAYYLGLILLLPVLIGLIVAALVIILIKNLSIKIRQYFFYLMASAIAIDVIILAFTYPARFIGPFLVFILAIAILNFNLYLFFFHRRGLVFTQAVFPIQILYYLYSVAAFIIASGIYLWDIQLKPRIHS